MIIRDLSRMNLMEILFEVSLIFILSQIKLNAVSSILLFDGLRSFERTLNNKIINKLIIVIVIMIIKIGIVILIIIIRIFKI
jgi:hypothetical protein